MQKRKHKKGEMLTPYERELLKSIPFKERKHPKVHYRKTKCESCGFEVMYQFIRCPACEAKR